MNTLIPNEMLAEIIVAREVPVKKRIQLVEEQIEIRKEYIVILKGVLRSLKQMDADSSHNSKS